MIGILTIIPYQRYRNRILHILDGLGSQFYKYVWSLCDFDLHTDSAYAYLPHRRREHAKLVQSTLMSRLDKNSISSLDAKHIILENKTGLLGAYEKQITSNNAKATKHNIEYLEFNSTNKVEISNEESCNPITDEFPKLSQTIFFR